MDWETIAAVAIPIVVGIVWLIRLEGRVNTHERMCEERQKRMDERHEAMAHLLDAMSQKLDKLLEAR